MEFNKNMRNAQEPRVTVLTPFYNTERYLEQCIRSVLAQDYENFEYILSDNCSTDRSLEIAREYARRDPRISLRTHDEFLGQPANYNRALRYMSPESEYCKIVQADDWIEPHCLTRLVEAAVRHPTAGIISGCFVAGRWLGGSGLPDREFFTGREACRTRLTSGGTYFGSPTCLMYRASVVRARDPFYAETGINVDTKLCFEVLADSDFVRVPQILMTLRRNDDPSITSGLAQFNPQLLLQYVLTYQYGPRYLEGDDLAQAKCKVHARYYQMLATARLRGAPDAFWEFHRAELARIGQAVRPGALAWAVARLVADKAFNPKRTVEQMMEKLTGNEVQ